MTFNFDNPQSDIHLYLQNDMHTQVHMHKSHITYTSPLTALRSLLMLIKCSLQNMSKAEIASILWKNRRLNMALIE